MHDGKDRVGEPSNGVPWLTCALVALCSGCFLWAETETLQADAAIAAELVVAEEYLVQHPYLEPPLLLEERMSPEVAGRLDMLPDGLRRPSGVLSRLLAREQAELDAFVGKAGTHLEGLPAQRLGLRATDPSGRAIATHLLVHGGWLHLVGNMALLIVLGSLLEGAYRRGVFAVLAGAGVAGSALCWIVLNASFTEPLIGTSGLAAGLLGAFAVRHGRSRVEPQSRQVLVATLLVLALPTCLGFEWSVARGVGAEPALAGVLNPSLWAMAGGFAGAAAAAACARLFGLERPGDPVVGDAAPASAVFDPQYQRALDLERAGDFDAAFNLLIGLLRRHPDDVDASMALWQVAGELGRPRAASAAILRVIRVEIQRGDTGSAIAHWLEVTSCGLESEADPALLMHMAPLLRTSGELAAASAALRAALDRSLDAEASSRLAVRVAREAAGIDRDTARDAAGRALSLLDLAPEERQEMEALLAELDPGTIGDGIAERGAPGIQDAAVVSDGDLIAPAEAEASVDAAVREGAAGFAPIEVEDSDRMPDRRVAVPIGMEPDGLAVELEGGLKEHLAFEAIEAIAVAAVEGLGDKTVLVVDLVLNWVSLAGEPLRLIRLRTDCFDPRHLAPDSDDPLDALRAWLVRLLDATDAFPLPDHQSVVGVPFAAFGSLAEYETHVLRIG